MRRISEWGLMIGGVALATVVHAQAPAIEKARNAAAAEESASEGNAKAAEGHAAEGDFGGGDTAATTDAADKAAAAEGGGEGGGNAEGGGAAPETYTVVPGDTLWDLCERFLQNPWYWPKIWSYNPQIENAHWIYPGNIIRFYPSEEAGAVAASEGGEGGEGGETAAAGEGEKPAEGGEGGEGGETMTAASPDGEGGEGEGGEGGEGEAFDAPGQLADERGAQDGDDSDYTHVPMAQIFDDGNVAKIFADRMGGQGLGLRLLNFVSKKELEKAGQIEVATEDHEWLTRFDTIQVSLKSKPNVGDRFQIFRTTREVRHPVTYSALGSVVELVGVASITRVDGTKAEALITDAWGEILRGDKIAPHKEWPEAIQAKANTKKLKGVVVEALDEFVSQLGEHHIVFLDKGRGDGVEAGNTFEVLRSQDAFNDDNLYVDEVIGKIMVLDAKDGASTALITNSTTEIYAGDRIEMRPADAAN